MKKPPVSSLNSDYQNVPEKQSKNITEKIIVCKIEQGPDVFRNYSLKDAIEELEKLFDS